MHTQPGYSNNFGTPLVFLILLHLLFYLYPLTGRGVFLKTNKYIKRRVSTSVGRQILRGLKKLSTTVLFFFGMLVLFYSNFSIAEGLAPVNPPVIHKVYVSMKQTIDPWTGILISEIANPSGEVLYQFLPHGFRLHFPLETNKTKSIDVFFEDLQGFEPKSEANSDLAQNHVKKTLYSMGPRMIRSHLAALQDTAYSLMITVKPKKILGFSKSSFSTEDLIITHIKVPQNQNISRITNEVSPNEVSLTEYLGQPLLKDFMQSQTSQPEAIENSPPSNKKAPIGFIHDSMTAKANSCKILLSRTP